MFQRVRKQITPAMILALVALVFAVTGGAFAAAGGSSPSHATLTASAAKKKKKAAPKSTRGPAGPAGKNGAPGAQGPAGAAGLAGPQGPAGKDGAPGEKGASGASGASVVSEPEEAGANCEEGGSSFHQEGSAAKTYACDGKEGPPGPACVGGECLLPEGATETGDWSFKVGIGEGRTTESISFPLRLSSAPEFHYVKFSEKGTAGAIAEGCSGQVETPTAAAGQLCLYEGSAKNLEAAEQGGNGDSRSGENVLFFAEDAKAVAEGAGSWAVAR